MLPGGIQNDIPNPFSQVLLLKQLEVAACRNWLVGSGLVLRFKQGFRSRNMVHRLEVAMNPDQKSDPL